MTIRLSTGLRNAMAQSLGVSGVFNKSSIDIYSGAQPASADSGATGTLLGTVTLGSLALTNETQATATVTITGGSTSVATLTVGGLNIIPDGPVAYNTSIAQTASDLADAINRNGMFTASVAGAVVTIKPRPGAGAAYNSAVVAATGSVTATFSPFAGGVADANGLQLAKPSSGVIAKPSTAVWSFAGVAIGTAGWFRMKGSVLDAGALVSGEPYYARLDGSIGTSGADMNLSNLAITVGSPNTIDTFSFTIPSQ